MMRSRHILLGLLLALLALSGCGEDARPTTTTTSTPQTASGVYQNMTVAQLAAQAKHKDYFLVNTHIPYAGELEATDRFIPFDETAQRLAEFPADKSAKIVLYCQSGRMSAIAADVLAKQGYTNVWNVEGGMVAWEQAGYSLIRK
jgi:rhodanese-related sulfurtransferase